MLWLDEKWNVYHINLVKLLDKLTVTVSGGVSSTGLLIINTSPARVNKWCWECSSWIQSLDKQITVRYSSFPNNGPILFNALKLVLPGDYGAGIAANGTELGLLLSKLHWNSTTTETKEDVFIRSPAASHTVAKFLILTGMTALVSPGGTKPRETSPPLVNSVVLPRSLIVMDGHDWDCAFEK